ncbi:MAG: DUF4390 domain-containing protein [Wenzhouxiangellaceae bacterium]|nr:DUF4390 domain-containing protein [Wenzhouxiangellaceae bacterium]
MSSCCRARWIATVFITLACVGCTDREATEPSSLRLDAALAERNQQLWLDARINFEPGPEIREALRSGVEITLVLAVHQQIRLGPLHWSRAWRSYPLRMGYLPLTEQWWLDIDGERTLFPRQWLMLDALASGHAYPLADADGLDPSRLSARVRLDRSALPPPMQLPALFSSTWRLRSPAWPSAPATS